MRAGRAIREQHALANWKCDECGHGHAHREAPASSWNIVDGAAVEVPNPDHRAGVFHCTAAGCPCTLEVSL